MLMVLISLSASGVCFLVTRASRVPRIGSYTIEKIGASSPDIKNCWMYLDTVVVVRFMF
jgi:hypothetical protein